MRTAAPERAAGPLIATPGPSAHPHESPAPRWSEADRAARPQHADPAPARRSGRAGRGRRAGRLRHSRHLHRRPSPVVPRRSSGRRGSDLEDLKNRGTVKNTPALRGRLYLYGLHLGCAACRSCLSLSGPHDLGFSIGLGHDEHACLVEKADDVAKLGHGVVGERDALVVRAHHRANELQVAETTQQLVLADRAGAGWGRELISLDHPWQPQRCAGRCDGDILASSGRPGLT